MVQNIIINLGYFNEQADAVGLQIRPSGIANADTQCGRIIFTVLREIIVGGKGLLMLQ